MIAYKMFRDNVLVQLTSREQRVTEGGVHLPDVNGSEYGSGILTGTVIDAGPGGYGDRDAFDNPIKRQFFPVEVSQGDRVLIRHDAGEPVDRDLRIVRASEIIGVVIPDVRIHDPDPGHVNKLLGLDA